MKTILRSFLIVSLFTALFAVNPPHAAAQRQEKPESLPAGLQEAALAATSGPFAETGDSYATAGNGLSFHLGSSGLMEGNGDNFTWSMRLSGFGRSAQVKETSAPETIQTDQRLEYRRPDLIEWYRTTVFGVQQGFIVESAPAGEGNLVLWFDLFTNLKGKVDEDGRGLSFAINDEETLRYDHLQAWDANGVELDARMIYTPNRIILQVNEREAAYPITIDPFWYKSQRVAPANNIHDQFGVSVAISGDTALIGANAVNFPSSKGPGAAYVFVRSGNTWSLQTKLVPSDGVEDDMFGISVALSGNTALIGAFSQSSFKGAAYIFVRNGTTWTQQAKLVASGGKVNDWFGYSVALTGDTALVGAPQGDKGTLTDTGSVYVFRRSGTTWAWSQKIYASPSQADAKFGYSLAVSGDTLVVGAPYYNDSWWDDNGAAYMFFWVPDEELWQQTEQVLHPDSGGNVLFGFSVAISEPTILVGAPQYSLPDAQHIGRAYVFVPVEMGAWGLLQTLSPSIAAEGAKFGYSVAISGDMAVIGVPFDDISYTNIGSAYVYVRNGSSWSEHKHIFSLQTSTADSYGWSVAVSGDMLLIGAPFNDWRNTNAGAAFFHHAYYSNLDLKVETSASLPGPFSKNDTVDLTTQVSNLGPSSAESVLLNIVLPDGFTLVSFSLESPGDYYDPASGAWNAGALASGASKELTIHAKVTSTPGQTVYFTPRLLYHDSNDANNKASLPLKIYKSYSLNGGFELYTGTSLIPNNWSAINFTGSDGKNTAVFQQGTASIKITGTSGITKSLTQTLNISGAGGDSFSLKLHVKGNVIPTTGACRAQVLLYNSSTLVATQTVNCSTGTYGFGQKTLNFTAASAFTKVVIKLTYAKAGGTVWFDNLTLFKAP